MVSLFLFLLVFPIAFLDGKATRYLLYEVNLGEGFNLRRDVYMRVANLVLELNKVEPWVLVLPPWGPLYHWQSGIGRQHNIRWSNFFDLPSLAAHVPVLEFEDFLEAQGKPLIEEVYHLQNYAEGWQDGEFVEKYDLRECLEDTGFNKEEDGLYSSWFWGYESVRASKFQCLSVQAAATFMAPFLLRETSASSVLFLRAENLIHGKHSEWSFLYWTARRSMRFSKRLREVGDKFRLENLDSSDERDRTVLEDNWEDMERMPGSALGGPYVAVHLRRRDFVAGHKHEVPSLETAARKVRAVLVELRLRDVFVATDAPLGEYESFRHELKEYQVHRYFPSKEELENLLDGGVAIVDQWICSHARYFIGTSVSTFTFRIIEERQIMGFDPKMSNNRFCTNENGTCEQPTKWETKYRDDHEEL